MEIVVLRLDPSAYFDACEAALRGGSESDRCLAYRLDLSSAEAVVLAMFPPRGFYWGIPMGSVVGLSEWDDELRVNDQFRFEVGALLNDRYDDLTTVPAPFVVYQYIGANNELEVGTRVSGLLSTRIQSVCLPRDESVIAVFCERFVRYVSELGSFAMLSPAVNGNSWLPTATEQSWEQGIHPTIQALFGRDHGRGVFGPDKSALQAVALKDALDHVSAEEARTWLTPRVLAEEFVRFRYPIPAAPTKMVKQVAHLFGLGSGALVAQDQVDLLRAKLVRKWGWPTWLRMLISLNSKSIHASMLDGAPAWEDMELEVAAILDSARTRYPVLFED